MQNKMTSSAAPRSREHAGPDARDQRVRAAALETKIVEILMWAALAAGILLRIQRYVLGRSFRNDEAALALAIQGRTILELITRPLGNNLTAPVGFLAVEKLIVGLLGPQDFIFRLFPLATGILSVLLMYRLAREIVEGVGALFCLAAFSLNWMAIFYSSDLKQYAGDVMLAVALYLTAARYMKAATVSNAVMLATLGLFAMWFSHPAIFLLACIGPVLLLTNRANKRAAWQVIAMGAIWVIGFLALYILFYRSVGQQPYIVYYWNDLNGLMPMPPWKDPGWFLTRGGSFLQIVLDLSPYVVIVAGLFAFGLVSFWRRGKWEWSAFVIGAILATLLGSAIANYPFKGRLILFLIPGTLLAIGEGIDGAASLLKSWPAISRLALWLMASFMLLAPGAGALNLLSEPRAWPYPEDIKPALAFIQENMQPDDMVVVYDQASPTYEYYAPFYGLRENPTFYLSDLRKQPRRYMSFIDVLPKNQRIWFIFSNVLATKDNISERTFILDYVHSTGGELLRQYATMGDLSSAYLTILR